MCVKNNNTIQDDINYKLYCSIGININNRTCYLEFINASNIHNGTVITVILRDGDDEVQNIIEETVYIDILGKYACFIIKYYLYCLGI